MRRFRYCLCVLCWIAALSLAALGTLGGTSGGEAAGAEPSSEVIPDGIKIVSVEAIPPRIELRHKFDYRQLLVVARSEAGEVIDLTRMVKLAQPAKFVAVGPTGLVTAVANGQEQLVFQYGSHSLPVTVDVASVENPYEVSFVRDVQPVLSKMGCNQGTCHGAREGKNGFKLSLRGYDPIYDHRALTDDIGSRRFNRAAPDQSLMLLKSTGSIPHVGGVRTDVGHPHYEILRQWIASGVKLDLDAPRVTRIEVLPKDPIVPRAGMKQQMVVLATYADGKVRDVTREAFIESGNIEILESSPQGIVTMLRRGEAPVLVRYEGAYAATTLIVMGDRAGFVWKPQPTNNYIDQHVYRKLERVKILPSDLCSDDEFVRRVTLDLTGLPPTADAVRAFLADARDSKTKRDALVNQLVGSPAYVEQWTNKWADLLQVNRKFLGEDGSVALRNWIKNAVATNMPYDRFAREILTADGSNLENPPAAYYKILRQPQDAMENTTHLFLAIRFNCNKCHDHPFERWTQDQYYQMAAFFAQVNRKEDPLFAGQKIGGSAVEGAAPLVEVVYDADGGEIKHDRTGQIAPPSVPFQSDLAVAKSGARREQLADWLTSRDNLYFARSYANRLWGYLLGRGLIEPIDDIRAGNPASNPELLDALARDFVDHGFDIQHVVRTICQSRAYQHSVRSNVWNEDDEINYSRALPRRLPAEVLFDAIHLAAGATPRVPGVPAGFRAAELPDAGVSVPFLEDFGRPVRESACECERTTGMVLGPVMKLINGPTVADALADPSNALAKLVASEPDDAKLIEEVFLRFLARRPTQQEIELGVDAIRTAGADHEKLVADLQAYEAQSAVRQADWEKSAGKPVVWTELDPKELKSVVGATLTKNADRSVSVSGANGKDVYSVAAETDLPGITGVRIEALADPALPAGGPGRAQNGNFVLSELRILAASKTESSKAATVELQNAQSDFNQDQWPVQNALDGNDTTGWAVSPQFNKAHWAWFETKQDVGHAGGTVLTFALSQQFPDGMHTLGRFRVSVTNSKRPFDRGSLPADVAAALNVAEAERNAQQKTTLANYFRSQDARYKELAQQVARSTEQQKNRRLLGVQDLAWALINSPAFLFNR